MGRDGQAEITALRALIEVESTSVRRGDFAALPELGARKAALIEALAQAGGAGIVGDLGSLRAAADANGRLLAAALRGVGAARARLAAIRQASTRLETYDSTGRAHAVSFAPSQVERRA